METRRSLLNKGVPKQSPSVLNMALVSSIFQWDATDFFSKTNTNNTKQQQEVHTSKKEEVSYPVFILSMFELNMNRTYFDVRLVIHYFIKRKLNELKLIEKLIL